MKTTKHKLTYQMQNINAYDALSKALYLIKFDESPDALEEVPFKDRQAIHAFLTTSLSSPIFEIIGVVNGQKDIMPIDQKCHYSHFLAQLLEYLEQQNIVLYESIFRNSSILSVCEDLHIRALHEIED